MAKKTKVIPKRQSQISQDSIETYNSAQKQPTPDILKKNRGYNRSVKNDDVKQFSIGLKDIDETIVYYFNNVIKPSVIHNGSKITVPVIYGSPERWASVQKDGFYRDKNGKIQTPLIMYKRESVEKNRELGNKLDANTPNNFSIFEKKYSSKNVYDRFSTLVNREPVKELYGVIIPDYVNIKYSCIIFTEYVSQMNKIVESVNFASDAYWGDPERFNFRAMIDSYATTTEISQGADRTVKTSFEISMLGHIVSDTINTSIANMNKFYSKASIKFLMETSGTEEIFNASINTPATEATTRFFDDTSSKTVNIYPQSTSTGLTAEEIAFLSLNVMIDTNTNGNSFDIGGNSITFTNVSFATVPANFPALTVDDFQVVINGLLIEPSAIDSITEVGADIKIQFNVGLNYVLDAGMEIVLIGKIIV